MGFLSKIINVFKSIRLNQENALTGDLLNHLLVGSMYAEQQSAYLNSYETGLSKSDVSKIVENWEVFNRNQVIEILISLQNRNHDEYIDFVYKAYEDPENYTTILKSNLPPEEDIFNYYLNVFRNLKNIVPELIEENIIKDFSDLKKIKDSGWNYGRGVFLARCCYELDYLTKDELKEYLSKSYSELKSYCSTWKEYTTSYIFGRAMWGGPHNAGMISIANNLLNDDRSPLKNKTYI